MSILSWGWNWWKGQTDTTQDNHIEELQDINNNVVEKISRAADLLITAEQVKIAWHAAMLSYKVGNRKKFTSEAEKFIKSFPQWEILCNSSDYSDTTWYGYKAVVLVNRQTKEVYLATAGTKEFKDLGDNWKIFRQEVLNKLVPAQALLDHVEELLDVESYKIITIGHSQAGALSPLITAEILGRGLNAGPCITCENPGAFAIVEKAIREKSISSKNPVFIDQVEALCITINGHDNWINTLNPALGIVKKFIVEQIGLVDDLVDAVEGWGQKITNYLYNKLEAVVSSFALGREIIQGIKNLQGHALKNFEDLDKALILCEPDSKELTLTKCGNAIVIQDCKNFEKIQSLNSPEKEVIVFCEKEESPSYTCPPYTVCDKTYCTWAQYQDIIENSHHILGELAPYLVAA